MDLINEDFLFFLAVLEKRASIRVSATNVFVNIAGGIRIIEPAADLAVCAAYCFKFN